MRFTTRDASIVIGLLILAAIFGTAYFYPDLPARLVMHWNASGQANGTADKSWAVWLIPSLSIFLALLLFVLPSLDPIDKGYRNFRKEYDALIVMLTAFFTLLQGVILAWNLGLQFNLSRFLAPAVGLLFFGLGTVMPGFKRNWFAGIRTPWTLSSDRVWNATHEQAGALFQLSGILACFGAVIPEFALYLLFVPILLSTLWVVLYSYLVYRKGAS